MYLLHAPYIASQNVYASSETGDSRATKGAEVGVCTQTVGWKARAGRVHGTAATALRGVQASATNGQVQHEHQ